MIETIITSIVSFASTNIDDIFVLLILFAKVDATFKKRHIIIGQYFGIGLLITISLLGAFGLNFFPQKYVGLLGLIPILLGIKEIVSNIRENKHTHLMENPDNNDSDCDSVGAKEEKSNSNINKRVMPSLNKVKGIATKVINPAILSVMLITIANGADNIGIYIPLFSSYTVNQLIVSILIFAVMIAMWFFLGEKIASVPLVKSKMQKYKHILVPIVFIMLGIYIIIESDVISLLLNT